MAVLFMAAFAIGLLLGVRLMFFGAQRRAVHAGGGVLVRRSEPALVAFLIVFGVASYLLTQAGTVHLLRGTATAVFLGAVWAAIATRLAVAAARLHPHHELQDPRFVLQGSIGVVVMAVPAAGEGAMRFDTGQGPQIIRARDVGNASLPIGEEVCIDRIEDGVAYVERWELVERRL